MFQAFFHNIFWMKNTLYTWLYVISENGLYHPENLNFQYTLEQNPRPELIVKVMPAWLHVTVILVLGYKKRETLVYLVDSNRDMEKLRKYHALCNFRF